MKKKKGLLAQQGGFTLIEMLIVLFIVSVLMLLVIPGMSGHQENAQKTGDAAFQSSLQSQVDLYRLEKDGPPSGFDEMKSAGYLTEQQTTKAKATYSIGSGGKVVKNGDG